MQADESQEPKNNDDLQRLWQQSIDNKSLNLQQKNMIQQLKKDVNKFNRERYLGDWKMVLLALAMTIGSAVVVVKAIQQGDVFQIGFRGATFVFFGSLACFNLGAAWKTRNFNDSNHRDFLEKNIQQLGWYIKFQKRTEPFVMLIAAYFMLFAFTDFMNVWFCILLAVLVTFVIVANMTSAEWDTSEIAAMRSKLNASLRKMNEQ